MIIKSVAMLPLNYHLKYREGTRHWSPVSESYSGLDALLGAIEHGWQLGSAVYSDLYSYGPGRQSVLYHVLLVNDDRSAQMLIVANPAMERFIVECNLDVIPIEQVAVPREWMHVLITQDSLQR
jgi:hypothetical protein